ncbi:aldo/keto reductase [Actinospica durhamensis]|uniref:Aldo/keto reductase n=1 Tax=Actinospica durhamensis TaxID=1508375 RepID=A0A941ELF9_9ACTN|nr:aldo/keto reductase [Actinospica durhamensis]MBR7833080.1 aldo/keto reductase [Actinospica durhamensis]
MDYVNLGRSGLRVSRACLGAMNFGTAAGARCPQDEALRIVDAFLDAGGNLIDTADVYGDGQSEQVVRRAIAGRRDAVVLATKGSGPRGRGPNDRGLSRVHLTRALDASLKRLGTDYVDLYQCHTWHPDTPIDETMSTLDGFVRAGKVRYLGCSNYPVGPLIESQWAAERAGATPFVSLQAQYSLIARSIEAEILPACDRHGLGLLAYSPLAAGILADRYERERQPPADSRLRYWLEFPNPAAGDAARAMLTDRSFDIAQEVARAARELGATSAATAIAWLTARPGVSSVIIGPRTLDQLHDNLAGFGLVLPAEMRRTLDAASLPANGPVTGMLVGG